MTLHLDARARGCVLAAAGCSLSLIVTEADAVAKPPTATYPSPLQSVRFGASSATAADHGLSASFSPRHVLVGRPVRARGKLPSGRPGATVVLELRVSGHWRTVDRTRTRTGGRFTASWRPRQPGTAHLRVSVRDRAPSAAASSAATDAVIAYRRARASWYGPGLYGRRLACGGRLTPGRIGVAHRRLPCGARVRLRYRGRTAVASVIDRGPYVSGRVWDLTEATKKRLAFPSTGVL